MRAIKIKDIPSDEEILLAKKVSFKDVWGYKNVKFVITNKALYMKLIGYLIDFTGTMSVRVDEIEKIEVETPKFFRYCRYITISGSTMDFLIAPFTKDSEEIVNVLVQINPNIILTRK